MFSHCSKILLLKSSRTYSWFFCSKMKAYVIDFTHPNVTHINRLNKFSVYYSLLLEKNEEYDPDKKKYRQKSVKEVLQKIEKFDDYLENPISLKRVLDTLDKAVEKEKRSKKDIQIILKSRGFTKILESVKSFLRDLPLAVDDELLKLLKIFNYLHVPFSNPICLDILFALKARLNVLSFGQAADFYRLLNADKSYPKIKHALMQELELNLEKSLQNKIYTKSANLAVLSLTICAYDFVPNEIRIKVLAHTIELPDWESPVLYKRFLQVLSRLPWDHPQCSAVEDAFFKKVNYFLKNTDHILPFLTGYAAFVRRRLYYDVQLIDTIVNKVIKKNPSSFELGKLIVALRYLNHVNYNVVDYIVDKMKNNSSYFIKSSVLCQDCFAYLANSNHDERNESRWNALHPFLRNFLAQSDFFQHIETDLEIFLHNVLHLASLGIYDDESLRLVSSRIKQTRNIKESPSFMRTLGLLNQAVKVLHPSFEKPLVNNDVLSFLINEIANHNSTYSRRNELLHNMNDRLNQVTQSKRTMLFNCFTRCGMLIDGVVAMNDEGKLYSFTENKDDEIIFIEKISIPENYKLINLMALKNMFYSKNTRSLKSFCSLQVKTLKAMGYGPVCIFEDDWRNELLKNNQGQYLLNKIHEQYCGQILKPTPKTASSDSFD